MTVVAASRHDTCGFTLLEMLVFLAIVSMIVAATPSVYSALVPNYRAREFANELADAARQLRLTAQQDGEVHTLEIADGTNAYWIDGQQADGPSGVRLGFSPAYAWHAQSVTKLEFYPNGASSGGTLTVSAGRIQVDVDVDWATGSVQVQQ